MKVKAQDFEWWLIEIENKENYWEERNNVVIINNFEWE